MKEQKQKGQTIAISPTSFMILEAMAKEKQETKTAIASQIILGASLLKQEEYHVLTSAGNILAVILKLEGSYVYPYGLRLSNETLLTLNLLNRLEKR